VNASADIWQEREDWRGPLGLSVALHALLFGGMFIYAAIRGTYHGETWGGTVSGGAAMSATLVSSIPLPRPPAPTQNVLATQSPGLSQSQPKPQETQPAPEAIPIPDKNTKQKKPSPKETHTVAQNTAQPVEQPANTVPFGQGAQPGAIPFNMSSGSGGLSLGSGGDFGSRYAWYVDKVRRVISENWLKYEVDPNVQSARRVYITFDISRSGQPENVQVEQSSGVPSLDISAKRALQRIDSFGPLPPDYRGDKVSVEFYFEYKR
jgi:protein TonB